MYLTAYSPSIEAVEHWLSYSIKKKDLKKRSPESFLKPDEKDDMGNITIATAEGISIEEYCRKRGERRKKAAIAKLDKEFGHLSESTDEDEDTRESAVRRYTDQMLAMKGKESEESKKLGQALKGFSKLFETGQLKKEPTEDDA